MGVYQGYNSDGTGQASNFIEDSTGADLNVGFSRVYAELQHRGSDVQIGYDWNVSYTISLGTTVMSTGIVNDCMQGIDMPYQYQPLGGPGMEIATVCVEVSKLDAMFICGITRWHPVFVFETEIPYKGIKKLCRAFSDSDSWNVCFDNSYFFTSSFKMS